MACETETTHADVNRQLFKVSGPLPLKTLTCSYDLFGADNFDLNQERPMVKELLIPHI